MSKRRKILFLTGIPALAILIWWTLASAETGPPALLKILALIWAAGATFWALRQIFRILLWRVSGRLAFSYFLIGVVPIPLVALLVSVGLYILAGFFLGHLYRNAAVTLQSDLQYMARSELDRMLGRKGKDETYEPVAATFAYYKDDTRLAGDPDLPERWRDFWPCPGNGPTMLGVTFFADSDGRPSLVGGARSGSLAVLARFDGDLDAELSHRSGIWTEVSRADQAREKERWTFVMSGREYPLEALKPTAPYEEIQKFFWHDEGEPGWQFRPWLVWLELTRPFLDLETGGSADEFVSATLTSSLDALSYDLIPGSAEVGFWVYLVFAGVFLGALNVYIIAALVALMMIFSLSRAVNRLTEATRKLQKGDFSTRIQIYREDQIGALQKSFNAMAGNLETLVADAADKEIFERELEIARQMQHGLLPDTLQAPAPLSFATYFQPSRAIGGDYYDLLTLADGRHAVVIADVSGHGLPAGLRMAMVKSAFELLCEESDNPIHILRRLHHLLLQRLQHRHKRRAFVTATLAAIDRQTGEMEIVNAGHTPTYRLRGDEVLEIQLPGPPLGALKPNYPSERFQIEDGDIWVWLSDGIVEAVNRQGEVFGYERVMEVIRSCAGASVDALTVKRAVLAAVAEHKGSAAVDDDLTLVVLCWDPEAKPGEVAEESDGTG